MPVLPTDGSIPASASGMNLFLSAYRFGKPVPVVMRSFAWEFPSALGASV